MKNIFKNFCCFLKALFDHFFDDHCPARAASLAYTTLLSIVPLMLLSFYILSYFPHLAGTGKQIEKFVLENFVASSASAIEDQLSIFIQHIKILSWTNIVALLVISALLILNMVSAVNQIWRVTLRHTYALSFLIYVIFLLLSPIAFGLVLMMSSYLTSIPLLLKFAEITYIKPSLLFVFPFIIEWVGFTLFNWILPSASVRLRYACFAGLITTILFEVAKYGFVQYIHYFPTYRLIYGALAIIPIFLVWIYVTWLVILLGVLVCYLLQYPDAR